MCMLSDGRLASASLDGRIKLWDVASGAEPQALAQAGEGLVPCELAVATLPPSTTPPPRRRLMLLAAKPAPPPDEEAIAAAAAEGLPPPAPVAAGPDDAQLIVLTSRRRRSTSAAARGTRCRWHPTCASRPLRRPRRASQATADSPRARSPTGAWPATTCRCRRPRLPASPPTVGPARLPPPPTARRHRPRRRRRSLPSWC